MLTIYYTTTTIYSNRGPVYSPAFHTCILENKILDSRQQEHFFLLLLYLAQERLRARSQKWKHPTDKTGHKDILYPCCLEHCEVNLKHCRRILSDLLIDMSNVCTESIYHSVSGEGGHSAELLWKIPPDVCRHRADKTVGRSSSSHNLW